MVILHKTLILSSFLILLLFVSTTSVYAQDDHDHDHGAPPPPLVVVPPPPVHDHDHDTVPPPPPPPPVAPIVNIFDTNGDLVVSGRKYYILPVVQNRGGGISFARKTKYEKCPLFVVQETKTSALGIPVRFNPIKPGSKNITFSANMNIVFSYTNECKQSPAWTVKPGHQPNDKQYVTLGGSTGYHGGPNMVKSWFKIERFFPRFHFDYKFVHCPNGYGKGTCGDLGVYVQKDGTWRLGVGAPPLRVKFMKA